MTIARQLDRAGTTPQFGPVKTGVRRTLTLGAETIAMLRTHKKAQRELMMRNRTTYTDHQLVFAKEEIDIQRPGDALGQPIKTLSESRFKALVKSANVPRKKFHACRHSVASVSLSVGTPPHVVAARLGHSVMELMRTYAHCLPNMQRDAADRLAAELHG